MKNYKECYNNLIKDLENLIDKYNGKSAQKRLLNRIKTMQKKYGDGNL